MPPLQTDPLLSGGSKHNNAATITDTSGQIQKGEKNEI